MINNTASRSAIYYSEDCNNYSFRNSIFKGNTNDDVDVNITWDNGLNVEIYRNVQGKVTVEFNNDKYSQALVNNTAKFNISNLKDKDNIFLTFVSDNSTFDINNTYIINSIVSINASTPDSPDNDTKKQDNESKKDNGTDEIITIKIPKITYKSKITFKAKVKIKKYTIRLTYNGKAIKKAKVYLKIKKTYYAVTNSKGKATFKIKKKKKKGTYKAKIIFGNNKTYKKVIKTVKIKIK